MTNTYENFIVTGDLNIDTLDDSMYINSYLSDFCNIYALRNLILGKTCFKGAPSSSVDVMLTYRPRRFQKTAVIETGLSDHPKLIVSFLSKYFARLPPKTMNTETIKELIRNGFFKNLNENY